MVPTGVPSKNTVSPNDSESAAHTIPAGGSLGGTYSPVRSRRTYQASILLSSWYSTAVRMPGRTRIASTTWLPASESPNRKAEFAFELSKSAVDLRSFTFFSRNAWRSKTRKPAQNSSKPTPLVSIENNRRLLTSESFFIGAISWTVRSLGPVPVQTWRVAFSVEIDNYRYKQERAFSRWLKSMVYLLLINILGVAYIVVK